MNIIIFKGPQCDMCNIHILHTLSVLKITPMCNLSANQELSSLLLIDALFAKYANSPFVLEISVISPRAKVTHNNVLVLEASVLAIAVMAEMCVSRRSTVHSCQKINHVKLLHSSPGCQQNQSENTAHTPDGDASSA